MRSISKFSFVSFSSDRRAFLFRLNILQIMAPETATFDSLLHSTVQMMLVETARVVITTKRQRRIVLILSVCSLCLPVCLSPDVLLFGLVLVSVPSSAVNILPLIAIVVVVVAVVVELPNATTSTRLR